MYHNLINFMINFQLSLALETMIDTNCINISITK